MNVKIQSVDKYRSRAARLAVSLILMTALAAPGLADRFRSFDKYTVHYSAFTTDILSQQVARQYGIVRSKNRSMLNITVLRKVMGTGVQPAKAKIEATATNLNGQLRQLELRELQEQDSLYYIAEISISNQEILNYKVSIIPEGESEPLLLEFQQQFFTD